ncbi:MAG: cytochrome d ubiquinol oxidase subunit II [Bacteroidaceae bacterium]|nr:cytochrome d ubiquinol oxidase subunit II [Bacteroidaceae bacterium]
MITYTFLQYYWWFLISLLAGLLVFLMFVQGGNSLLFTLGKSEEEREMLVNSTGRKWEFTFTTLVTFGGAFFASFPLFYSTSFGGAYWLWMLILLSFVLQAVSYEFQSKLGNVLGRRGYRVLLVLNGFLGPFLLGVAVATFFNGSQFVVSKDNMASLAMPIVSSWASSFHGLEALLNPWNLILGFAVFFLARVLGLFYFINNVEDAELRRRCRLKLRSDAVLFLIFFLAFVGWVMMKPGFAVGSEGVVKMEPHKYFYNLIQMPAVAAIFGLGVIGVLFALIRTWISKSFVRGIWAAGAGTVLAVLGLLLLAGYNNTAYYPSTTDLQSSLTLQNSCSSEFTLKVMSGVSLLIPFVLAYIAYCWNAMDLKGITRKEIQNSKTKY